MAPLVTWSLNPGGGAAIAAVRVMSSETFDGVRPADERASAAAAVLVNVVASGTGLGTMKLLAGWNRCGTGEEAPRPCRCERPGLCTKETSVPRDAAKMLGHWGPALCANVLMFDCAMTNVQLATDFHGARTGFRWRACGVRKRKCRCCCGDGRRDGRDDVQGGARAAALSMTSPTAAGPRAGAVPAPVRQHQCPESGRRRGRAGRDEGGGAP